MKNLPPFLELLKGQIILKDFWYPGILPKNKQKSPFEIIWPLVAAKQSGIFHQFFLGFSDYLNFNAWKHICVQECSFRWKFNPIVNPLGICFCLFFKYHLLSPKHLAQRNFYCNSRKFYPSYVQHATNCWISCILPSFFSLFHTFSKLHSKSFIDKPNVRSLELSY